MIMLESSPQNPNLIIKAPTLGLTPRFGERPRRFQGILIDSWEVKDTGIWVVVKIRVPFCVPIIIRHPLFRVPKKGP